MSPSSETTADRRHLAGSWAVRRTAVLHLYEDAPGNAGVVVYLNKVRHLIDVWATAGSDLAGEIAGDPPVEPLFFGGEQIGWGVRD